MLKPMYVYVKCNIQVRKRILVDTTDNSLLEEQAKGFAKEMNKYFEPTILKLNRDSPHRFWIDKEIEAVEI